MVGANLQSELQSLIAIGVILASFVGLAPSMLSRFEMQMPTA